MHTSKSVMEAVRWVARIASLMVSSLFLLVIFSEIFSKDPTPGPAVPILVLLALTVLGCFLAWRWERLGGGIVIVGSIGLGFAVYSATLAFGLASYYTLFLFIYCLPFLIVGTLFLACSQARHKAG